MDDGVRRRAVLGVVGVGWIKARQGINQLVRYDPGPGGGDFTVLRPPWRGTAAAAAHKYTVVSGVRTVGDATASVPGRQTHHAFMLLPPPCARLVVLLFSLYRRNSPVRCTVSYYSK
jgi:hypothetical protein